MIRFVGGPWDGRRLDLPPGTPSYLVEADRHVLVGVVPAVLFRVPPYHRYQRDTLREEQAFRGGVAGNPRRFIVEEDVMRYRGLW